MELKSLEKTTYLTVESLVLFLYCFLKTIDVLGMPAMVTCHGGGRG